jgi:hypothetical protein
VELTLLSPEHAPPVLGYGFRSPVDQQISMDNISLTPIELESGVSKFDLTVLLWDMADRVQGTFEYSAKLFKMATVAKMVSDYGRLLAHIAATPDVQLATLTGIIEGNTKEGRKQTIKKMSKKSLRHNRPTIRK